MNRYHVHLFNNGQTWKIEVIASEYRKTNQANLGPHTIVFLSIENGEPNVVAEFPRELIAAIVNAGKE